MNVLCLSGSRADFRGVEATHNALQHRGISSTLYTTSAQDNEDGFLKKNDYKIVVLLGDRKEILRFATYFYLEKMIICHLSGGDITEGSQDDSMRHAITKLAHLHFPTNWHSAQIIKQMGEESWRVHTVGYPGADNMKTYDHSVAAKLVGAEDYILVVWHPNTLAPISEAVAEAAVLAEALEQMPYKKLILSPNLDEGGIQIANYFEVWASRNDGRYIATLPPDMYLTVMRHAKCMIGNSSSGFYEAPTFGTPVVNVGDRQQGRIVPPNMVHAGVDVNDVVESFNIAIRNEQLLGRFKDNVYQKGDAANKIAVVIEQVIKSGDTAKLLKKGFVRNADLANTLDI